MAACRRCGETAPTGPIVGLSPPARCVVPLRGEYAQALLLCPLQRCVDALLLYQGLRSKVETSLLQLPLCGLHPSFYRISLVSMVFLFKDYRHGAVRRRVSAMIGKSVAMLTDTANAAAAALFLGHSMLDLRPCVRKIDGSWTGLKRPTAYCSTSTSGERAGKSVPTHVSLLTLGLTPAVWYVQCADTASPSRYIYTGVSGTGIS